MICTSKWAAKHFTPPHHHALTRVSKMLVEVEGLYNRIAELAKTESKGSTGDRDQRHIVEPDDYHIGGIEGSEGGGGPAQHADYARGELDDSGSSGVSCYSNGHSPAQPPGQAGVVSGLAALNIALDRILAAKTDLDLELRDDRAGSAGERPESDIESGRDSNEQADNKARKLSYDEAQEMEYFNLGTTQRSKSKKARTTSDV